MWLGIIFLKWTQERGLGWQLKLPFEKLVHALCNFLEGALQPNTIMSLTYNIKVPTTYYPLFWCCSLVFVLECVFLNCHIVLRVACHSYEIVCMTRHALFIDPNVIVDLWQDQLHVVHMSTIDTLFFLGAQVIGGAKPKIWTHEKP
jgi:hypothetical protein